MCTTLRHFAAQTANKQRASTQNQHRRNVGLRQQNSESCLRCDVPPFWWKGPPHRRTPRKNKHHFLLARENLVFRLA
jgi:hypothetical protein